MVRHSVRRVVSCSAGTGERLKPDCCGVGFARRSTRPERTVRAPPGSQSAGGRTIALARVRRAWPRPGVQPPPWEGPSLGSEQSLEHGERTRPGADERRPDAHPNRSPGVDCVANESAERRRASPTVRRIRLVHRRLHREERPSDGHREELVVRRSSGTGCARPACSDPWAGSPPAWTTR